MISVPFPSADSARISIFNLSQSLRHRYSPIPVERSRFLPFVPVNPFSKIRGISSLQLSANPIILFKLASFYHTGHKVSILCILFPNTKSQKRLQPIDSGWSLNDYNFFCFLTVSTTVLPFIFTNVILYYYFITILIRLVYRNTILLYQYIALIYSYSLINSYSTA